jgi:hypothetical protein
MKKMLAALALAIALPAVAHAQAAPAPAPAPEKKMDCCDKHGKGKAGQDDHAGHDMSQHQQHQKPNQ